MNEFYAGILAINSECIMDKVCSFIRDQVKTEKRDGIVIGLSGGVDSALCASLCVKAIGAENVIGLILPEKESNPISAEYALGQTHQLGIRTKVLDITGSIASFGAYEQRDAVLRSFYPKFDNNCKFKIVLPGDLLERDSYNFYTLVIDDGTGNLWSTRLDNKSLRKIVAATNLKQRTRMMYLYNSAEELNYLVCGTTNKSEAIQGFFVKWGDGGVDIEPIEALYKTQVYQLARYLNVTEQIIKRAPSPDTFGLVATDEEFYFRLPYAKLDLLLFAWENSVTPDKVGRVMDLTTEQVKRVFRDLTAKFNATKHLRALPPSISFTLDELIQKPREER